MNALADEDIERLRARAEASGDERVVRLCEIALNRLENTAQWGIDYARELLEEELAREAGASQ